MLRFDNLPPGLREQAEIYGKSAEVSSPAKKLVGATATSRPASATTTTSNPRPATAQSPWSTAARSRLPPEALRRGDQYKAVAAGGELAYALSERFSAYGGAKDVRARFYPDIDTSDNLTVEGRAWNRLQRRREQPARGGGRRGILARQPKIRNSIGAQADYRYLAGKQDQLTSNVTAMRYRFPLEGLTVQDFDLYQVAVGCCTPPRAARRRSASPFLAARRMQRRSPRRRQAVLRPAPGPAGVAVEQRFGFPGGRRAGRQIHLKRSVR